MTRRILVLNGPNLNLLWHSRGSTCTARRPSTTSSLRSTQLLPRGDVQVYDVQSNAEGALIDALQEARSWADGVIFDPGAYTHYSIALRDAIRFGSTCQVVETHLSNVHAREDFRHTSLAVTGVCLGVIAGFGPDSYLLALDALFVTSSTRRGRARRRSSSLRLWIFASCLHRIAGGLFGRHARSLPLAARHRVNSAVVGSATPRGGRCHVGCEAVGAPASSGAGAIAMVYREGPHTAAAAWLGPRRHAGGRLADHCCWRRR